MRPTLFAACSLLLSCAAFAQQLVGLMPDKPRVEVGEIVKFMLTLQERERIWCGLRVSFGDGEIRDVRVDQTPYTLVKQYAAAGRFDVHAEGKLVVRGLMTATPCPGQAQVAQLLVVDPAAEQKHQTELREIERQKAEVADRERKLKRREQELQNQQEHDRSHPGGQTAGGPPASPSPVSTPSGSAITAPQSSTNPSRPAGKTRAADTSARAASSVKPKDASLKVFE